LPISYGDSKVRGLKYGMLHGVNRDRCGQGATLYGVNKDLSVTRRHLIWRKKIFLLEKGLYMGQ